MTQKPCIYTIEMFEREIENVIIEEDASSELAKLIAKRLAREYYDKNIPKCWVIKGGLKVWISGFLYLGFIKANKPKTAGEIEQITYAGENDIINAAKKIKKAIGMKYCVKASLMAPGCILRPTVEQYVDSCCKTMNIEDNIKEKAIKLAKKLKDFSQLTGRSPLSLAAACIYISSEIYPPQHKYILEENENVLKFEDDDEDVDRRVLRRDKTISQENISRALGITAISLRSAYNSIRDLHEKLNDKKISNYFKVTNSK
jgi:transcription initiation factor TFIIIB Brf1 subunit/transcription initiation factor TFIIB